MVWSCVRALRCPPDMPACRPYAPADCLWRRCARRSTHSTARSCARKWLPTPSCTGACASVRVCVCSRVRACERVRRARSECHQYRRSTSRDPSLHPRHEGTHVPHASQRTRRVPSQPQPSPPHARRHAAQASRPTGRSRQQRRAMLPTLRTRRTTTHPGPPPCRPTPVSNMYVHQRLAALRCL